MDIVVEISAPNLCALCVSSMCLNFVLSCAEYECVPIIENVKLKMLYSARSEKWKYRNSELENI